MPVIESLRYSVKGMHILESIRIPAQAPAGLTEYLPRKERKF